MVKIIKAQIVARVYLVESVFFSLTINIQMK